MSFIQGFTDSAYVNSEMVLASGRLAFDVGANGGYVAKILTRCFDRVIACEPATESFQRLVPRCPIPNLVCLNIAVSDHQGEIELGEKSWTESHGELFTGDSLGDIWGPDTGRRTVECTTLDTLASEYGYPDFLKIDTEGHEKEIVDGGMKVLESAPKFIIEIHSEANGEYIAGVLKDLELNYTISRHQSYVGGSYNYYNHYWMVNVNDHRR